MISDFLFVSVFCGEHVLCDKKEKEGISNLVWSRVLRPQVPVAAWDPQNSVSLAQPAPWGVLPLGLFPSPPGCAQCSPVLPTVSPTFSLPPFFKFSPGDGRAPPPPLYTREMSGKERAKGGAMGGPLPTPPSPSLQASGDRLQFSSGHHLGKA